MFAYYIYHTAFEIGGVITSTLVVAIAFVGMAYSYTRKRARQCYARNRKPAPDIPFFSLLSKLLFVSSMLLTLLSLWVKSPLLLQLYHNIIVQFIGALLVLAGFVNLQFAFSHLGQQYSPSFDAYLPSRLITTGHYRLIRHPIYLFNLFVSFGLAITSGSALVFSNAIIGLVFILKIIRIEEQSLLEHFPEYRTYASKTRRLLPFY